MNTRDPTDQHAIERQEAREMLSALGLASLYLLPSLPPRDADRSTENQSESSFERTP